MTGALDELLPPPRLEAALKELFPGLAVLERDLEIPVGDRIVRADLAGIDALGRLWLVARADADEDQALLDALELASFARREAAGLVAASPDGPGGPDSPAPAVALLCTSASATLRRRVAAVDAVRLVEVVSWKSGGRTHARLVERGAAEPRAPWTVERFLEELAPVHRALAETGVARLPGLDPALRIVAGESLLSWSGPSGELARLVGRGSRLTGVTGSSEATIDGPDDLERWLAGAFDRRIGPRDETDLPELPVHELPPARPTAPLLSAEELEAFRD